MKVGVGSYAYRWSIGIGTYRPARPLGALELLERAAERGAEVVQYADNLPLHDLGDAELTELRRRAERLGVELELGTDGASCANLERYLKLARKLGARLVRLTLDREDVARARSDLATELARAGDVYHEADSALAIENHFLMPSRELAALVEELDHPAVGVCLDVANSIASGEWPSETVERLAPFARNLHLKDYRIAVDPDGVGFRIVGTPIGQGRLDAGAVLQALRDAGRDVNAVVEHWLPRSLVQEMDDPRALEDAWTAESLVRAKESIATLFG